MASAKRSLLVKHEVRIRAFEVAQWYDKQAPDSRTALDFFEELDAHLALIEERPEGFPVRSGTIRRVPFKVFPYALDYRLTETQILVVQLVAMAQET